MTTADLLLAADNRNTPLAARDARILRDTWDAHGYRPPGMPATRAGFNGEFQERRGVYLLGSYRAYNPALMRFHSADSLSPFGRGGLNAYAYCLGDPVNYRDPTGRVPWWVGMVAGVAATALAMPLAAFLLPASSQITVAAVSVAAFADTLSLGTGIAAAVVTPGMARDLLGALSLGAGIAGGIATGVAMRGYAARLVKDVAPRGSSAIQPGIMVEGLEMSDMLSEAYHRPTAVSLEQAARSANAHVTRLEKRLLKSSRSAGQRIILENDLEYARRTAAFANEELERYLANQPPSFDDMLFRGRHDYQVLSGFGASAREVRST